MNTIIKNTLILIATTLTVLSCSKREVIDYGQNDENGKLQMKMQVKVNVITSTPGTKIPTRADNTLSTDNFIVKICKAANGAIAEDGKEEIAKDVNGVSAIYTYSSMPEIITLNTGKYYILAYSHEADNAAWEVPYYQGTSSVFDIKKSELTTVSDVECRLHNVRVTVSYSATILKELTDFTITVDNGVKPDGFLIFGKDDENKVAYFTATSSLTVTLNGVRRDGEIVNHTQTISDVKPGEERHIKLDIILTGSITSSLKIDMNVTTIDHTIKVPGDEGSIIDPDPNPEPGEEYNISIIGQDFDLNTPVVYPAGTTKNVIVNITADAGINELWVDIESTFLTEAELGSVGLPKKFNLAEPNMYAIFGPDAFALVQEPVTDKTTLKFDITSFTSMIGLAGTHKFHLTIIDNMDQELTKTLTLKTE